MPSVFYLAKTSVSLPPFFKNFLINTFISGLYVLLFLATMIYALLFLHIVRCKIDENYIFRGQNYGPRVKE